MSAAVREAHREGVMRGEHEAITLALVNLKHRCMASGLYRTGHALEAPILEVGFERAAFKYPSQDPAECKRRERQGERYLRVRRAEVRR